DRAEAMLDGSEHQITNVLAGDAAGSGEETHGLAITAVEREGDSHPFTVVAADLKAVGAPAAGSRFDRPSPLLAPPRPPRHRRPRRVWRRSGGPGTFTPG